MSVEQTRPYRMPQPEQWCSEHEPWGTLCMAFFPAAIIGSLALLIGWLA